MSAGATLPRAVPHTNRSKTNRPAGGNPTPAEIRRAREDAGLTQQQAAELVHTGWHSWQKWEADSGDANNRRMLPAVWELFNVKLRVLERLRRGDMSRAELRALGVYLPDPER